MKNTQISPFAITGRGYSNYKIQKPIRLIELFAGIGAQAKALEKLHVNFEHYKICEFDKYAVASYNAIHNTNFATSDITQLHANDLEIVDTDKYEYILTYSFPCQDLSLAGKQQGVKKGTQTRSGLLWEVERLLKECKELPQVLLMENVPQVHSSKNYEDFKEWQNFLSNLGYQNFWADLNAKNYGIPQNRNRTFMVSILGNSPYEFPEPSPLKLELKDLLEDTVDEKYYLSDKMIEYIIADNEKWTGNNGKSLINKSVASTINTGEGSRRCDALNYIAKGLPEDTDIKLIQVGNLSSINESCRRVYDTEGIAPTINTLWTETQMKMITKDGNVKRYINSDVVDKFDEGDCADISFPNGYNKGNRVFKRYSPTLNVTTTKSSFIVKVKDKLGNEIPLKSSPKNLVQTIEQNELPINEVRNMDLYNHSVSEISQILTEPHHNSQRLWDGLRIRKLTPKECWRLMGFNDEDFEKASKVNSNTQLYKQAGNSIVVNVLMEIFRQMF